MTSQRLIVGILSASVLLIPALLPAATDYTLLEPLPLGPNGEVEPTVNTAEYVGNLFRLIIALASVLAVFRLIVAGITYMTTDAFGAKAAAKGQIQETMAGLALVLGSWLIVAFLIPPKEGKDYFEFTLTLPSTELKPNENLPKFTPPGTTPGTGGGLQEATIQAIVGLRQECDCVVRVTSTTGDSHDPKSLHYQGLAVDIGASSDLTKYLTGKTTNPAACSTYSKTLNGVSSRFLWEPTGSRCGGAVASTGDHWHMSVSK